MNRAHLNNGFTLIELMIVIVILAVVVGIALPTYNDQIRDTRRTDGQQAVLATANSLERFFTNNNVYSANLAALGASANSPEGHYVVSIALANANRDYTITATAQNDQANDDCGNLTLNSTGVRGRSGTAPLNDCW